MRGHDVDKDVVRGGQAGPDGIQGGVTINFARFPMKYEVGDQVNVGMGKGWVEEASASRTPLPAQHEEDSEAN